MQSIEAIKPFIKDRTFKNLLYRHYETYNSFFKEVQHRCTDAGYEMTETGILTKAVMYMSIIKNTIADKSVSKLAEMMIQGVNMGIISCVKIINTLESEECTDIEIVARLLASLQEQLDELKVYL